MKSGSSPWSAVPRESQKVPESTKQAMRGPENKAGHEVEREHFEEYQRFAVTYGVLPTSEQRISAERVFKLRERIAFSGTADTSVMQRLSNENATIQAKEKRANLGALGSSFKSS